MNFFRLELNFYQWSKKASPFKTKGRTGKGISLAPQSDKKEDTRIKLFFKNALVIEVWNSLCEVAPKARP